jgi:hypothetical protein
MLNFVKLWLQKKFKQLISSPPLLLLLMLLLLEPGWMKISIRNKHPQIATPQKVKNKTNVAFSSREYQISPTHKKFITVTILAKIVLFSRTTNYAILQILTRKRVLSEKFDYLHFAS